jgi:hypothetical protein
VDLEGDAFAQVLPVVVQVNAETIPAHPLLIDEVCAMVCGQVAAIASPNPVSPSTQAISTSLTPRLASSAHTPAQKLGLDPDAQDVTDTVDVDADGNVSGLVADLMTVANLDHQGVEVDDRVDRVQGPALPFQDLLEHRVGDLADRSREISVPIVVAR